MPDLRPLTADQELRLRGLKRAFTDHLSHLIAHGLRTAKDGRLQLPLPELTAFLDKAYLQGRNDASD